MMRGGRKLGFFDVLLVEFHLLVADRSNQERAFWSLGHCSGNLREGRKAEGLLWRCLALQRQQEHQERWEAIQAGGGWDGSNKQLATVGRDLAWG